MSQSEFSPLDYQPSLTYKDAGVDITAGNNLVERIKPVVKGTIRPGADSDLGGFGGLFDLAACKYRDPVLVAGTDGVGTKLEVARIINNHSTIGIDLVAMVVNDLVVQGAEPLFFLDYFATGKLNVDEAEQVIRGIADGCKQSRCALIGGETAEMPGMYKEGDYDLAGFAVGVVERDSILPKQNTVAVGDVVIGLPSSGIHSNGFSLVRHIMQTTETSYDHVPDGDYRMLGDIFLEPTRIYVNTCLALAKTGKIKAFAHITGGGLTENVPRILPASKSVTFDCASWTPPAVFKWLSEQGNVLPDEMLRSFNCGIGMVAIVSQDAQPVVTKALDKLNEEYYIIGEVTEKEKILYHNITELFI